MYLYISLSLYLSLSLSLYIYIYIYNRVMVFLLQAGVRHVLKQHFGFAEWLQIWMQTQYAQFS